MEIAMVLEVPDANERQKTRMVEPSLSEVRQELRS